MATWFCSRFLRTVFFGTERACFDSTDPLPKSRSPFTTSKALHTICPVQRGSTKSFCGEGIRMRTGSARALLVAIVLISSVTVRAQQPQDGEAQGTAQSQPASLSSGGLKVEPAPSSSAAPQASSLQTTHRFWDRTNDLWFAAVGAGRALDYASTLNLRRRGVAAYPTCFIVPAITNSSGGLPSCILVWPPAVPRAITLSRRHIILNPRHSFAAQCKPPCLRAWRRLHHTPRATSRKLLRRYTTREI